MTEQLRLFLALELPEAVKQELTLMQQQLRSERLPVSWVSPVAMHLTLVFLGETDAALLPTIGTQLRSSLVGHQPLVLQLGAPGAFPNLRRPNVLWVGIAGATAALGHLQAAVATALEPLGFPREARPYSAHLTLGRVRRDASASDRARLGTLVQALATPQPLTWDVDRVVLFQSTLRPSGPIYTERDTIALAR
jgi:2'-5' RNA ligase